VASVCEEKEVCRIAEYKKLDLQSCGRH